MSVAAISPTPTDADSRIAGSIAKCLEEAISGPAMSGTVEKVTYRGVEIELAASRGWGLRLTRPGTTTLTRHLTGEDLTLDKAVGAFAELLMA